LEVVVVAALHSHLLRTSPLLYGAEPTDLSVSSPVQGSTSMAETVMTAFGSEV
jgi:hypothetical protein